MEKSLLAIAVDTVFFAAFSNVLLFAVSAMGSSTHLSTRNTSQRIGGRFFRRGRICLEGERGRT
jgi:hypothetical protein